MAKKVLKGIKGMLGGGKKRKAAPEAEGGPIITSLNGDGSTPGERLRDAVARKRARDAAAVGTVLSTTLGGQRQRLGG